MNILRWFALAVLALAAGSAVAQSGSNIAPLSPPLSVKPMAGVPITASFGHHALTKQDADAWLDGYVPYALNSGDIPGAVVVVVKDGQILTARGFGYANVEKRIPVDPEHTLFRPGSVSKLAIWTAVMQQVEQGKINLDKDVNAYIDFKIPPYRGQGVTMRQLMTHTGGFEETAKGIIFYDSKHLLSLGDYLKREIPKRIYAPGTTPAYSNWGTALAGYIVQRTSGEELANYLDRHIFAPLNMRNSTFRQPLPPSLKAQMAVGYSKPGQPSLGFELLGPWPAGSESASGTDMGRFMIAHLQNGRGLLQPATAQYMHDSPTSAVNPMSLIPPLNRMELGFFETNVNGREVIGHLGDTEAFHTSLHLFMKDGVGFYASFNSPGKGGAAGTLRKAVFMDFADRYFPNVAGPDGQVDAKRSSQHAKMMVGVWEASRRWETHYFSVLNLLGQAKVAVDGKGQLVIPSLVGPNGRPQEWVEIAPFVWRDRNGHDRLAAKLVNGKVVRWATDFFSPFELFDRVPAGKSSAWIMPALYASIAILSLTVLAWPIGWWNRRRYKSEFPLAGRALTAYRSSRIASAAALGIVIGWGVAFALALSSAAELTGSLDPLLWILQIAGLLVMLALIGATAWNLYEAFRHGRWYRKVWAILMLLAALALFYVAWKFGLFAMTVNY